MTRCLLINLVMTWRVHYNGNWSHPVLSSHVWWNAMFSARSASHVYLKKGFGWRWIKNDMGGNASPALCDRRYYQNQCKLQMVKRWTLADSCVARTNLVRKWRLRTAQVTAKGKTLRRAKPVSIYLLTTPMCPSLSRSLRKFILLTDFFSLIFKIL